MERAMERLQQDHQAAEDTLGTLAALGRWDPPLHHLHGKPRSYEADY
jgi:hypothetical protein